MVVESIPQTKKYILLRSIYNNYIVMKMKSWCVEIKDIEQIEMMYLTLLISILL